MTESIHPDTVMGTVHLAVSDLGRSLVYYQDNIGLTLQRQDDNVARLGVKGRELLRLTEKPGARLAQRVTGLYHFALLLPSRLDLARILSHFVSSETPLGGFADHDVSEAIYLSDPDGHGIEIYRDRSRQEWHYDGDQLRITTERFDAEGVLEELHDADGSWEGLPDATIMGHTHLHVADIPAAEHFYVDVLGFDLIARYGLGAIFLSAGGYHHHLGLNTWAGQGAPPPPPEALSLNWYEIRLPDVSALADVMKRISAAGLPYTEAEEGVFVADASANRLLLTSS
jgi:catechol 2,3-dioxygenase